jgi:predicted  nucleic acid-binding Zn-ribbon protein
MHRTRTEGQPAVPNCCPSCLQELKEQKEELLTKVQALKTDLQDWRTKLEAQVKNYKSVRGYYCSW